MSDVKVPDHEILRTLRHVEGQRVVYRTRAASLGECTTRVVLGARIHRRYGETVRSIVCAGRGSSAGLPEDIALTLEGYRVAARLPRALRTGIAIAPRFERRAELPPDGEHWAARDVDPEEAQFSGLRWTQLPTEARWDWRTEAVDAGVTEEGHVYICTRYVEGEPISSLAEQIRGAAGTTIAWNVALILAELHAHNVVYGDLKPANLVLTRTGRVVLIDLDTLREVGGPAIPSRTRDATRNWAAPEQLDRQETYLASDLWSYARLLESLWPEGLPGEVNLVRRACHNLEPLRRPNTRSLLARMSGIWLAENDARARYGFVEELGDQPLLDWLERETPSMEEPPTGPVPEYVHAGRTDRVADAAPIHTDRVETGRVGTERVGTERVEVTPEPAQPLLRPLSDERSVPTRSTGNGCAPQLFGWGVAATLGFGVAMACAIFAWRLFGEHTANEVADTLVARLKDHKTDVARNTDAEIAAIRADADANWEEAQTPRSCAARALSTVWEEGWHRDKPWNAARYEETRKVTLEPLCGMEPEAMLARATLSTAACINRDPDVPSFSECDAALLSLEGLRTRLPATEDWHWMRVEALWQEVRTRRTLAMRYAKTGNAEQTSMFAAASAACDEAVPLLGYAPVNGPELFESCLPIAGHLQSLDAYLRWSHALYAVPLPTSSTARRYRLGHAYRDWDDACTAVSLKKSGGGWDVSGPPWCVALGHLARGCVADALKEIETRGGDAGHDWAALRAQAGAASSSTCIQ